ncbi:MAG: hypothetical protein GX761_09430 [Gammaproteobacteria bacterium]|nr:hypothetical protein [Gammaproteobacteria bacterium]
MNQPGKLRAGAGAEWLLGGFGLLKKQPLALGLVGLVFAIVSLLPLLFAAVPMLSLLGQLVVVVLTPILFGGMVHAVREVDQGRSAHPGQLLQGIREGKAMALVAQLLPQIAAGLVVIVLLVVMVGPTALQGMMAAVEQSQGGANPDPAMFDGFPFGAFALWMLLALVVGLFAYMFTFLFPAQVMFDGTPPLEAMKRSFRACIANMGAFLVFIVMFMLVAIGIMIAAQIVGMIIGIFAGALVASLVAQLLMMAVLMPVLMGAVYFAWRQMIGGSAREAGIQPPPASGIEV